MKTTAFLVLTKSHGVVRHTKKWPHLARDEIGVRLSLNIPDSAFRAPTVSVDVTLQEEQLIQPTVDVTVVEPPPGGIYIESEK